MLSRQWKKSPYIFQKPLMLALTSQVRSARGLKVTWFPGYLWNKAHGPELLWASALHVLLKCSLDFYKWVKGAQMWLSLLIQRASRYKLKATCIHVWPRTPINMAQHKIVTYIKRHTLVLNLWIGRMTSGNCGCLHIEF